MTPATASALTAVGGKAFWFLTRASGLVSIVLLSATIVLGVVASVGWTTQRWPRFVSQDVHRNLSLLCIAFVGVHVVTTVVDGYVPIGLLDVVLPFHSPYRPVYIGLGALGFDLLLAVLITSGLRHRIGYSSWRFVHWLAYLCWPIALIHGLGSGTDTPLPVVLLVEGACTAAVLVAFAWRLTTGRSLPVSGRTAAAATTAPTSSGASGSVPAVPFTSQVTGTQTQTRPDARGTIQITLGMHLHDAASTPLTVVLSGQESAGGGVSLSSGTVAYGPYHGTVVGLNGGTVTMRVAAPATTTLVATLAIDQQTGALTGSVAGSSGSGR